MSISLTVCNTCFLSLNQSIKGTEGQHPILRDWLPCAASTRSDTSSPGADPSLVVTSCLVMIGTASSFHALPYVQGAQGAGCYAPPRRRASQTAIRSQPSRSQRSLRPMVDHIVTEVQATITTSTTRGHAAGHRSDVSPMCMCGGLRVSNACQEGGGAMPENVRHNQRGSYWIPGSYSRGQGSEITLAAG